MKFYNDNDILLNILKKFDKFKIKFLFCVKKYVIIFLKKKIIFNSTRKIVNIKSILKDKIKFHQFHVWELQFGAICNYRASTSCGFGFPRTNFGKKEYVCASINAVNCMRRYTCSWLLSVHCRQKIYKDAASLKTLI